MPFFPKKKAVSDREVDPVDTPISTPRYFLTQHIVACAPLIEYISWGLFDCVSGAQATTHRIILTQVTFRGQIDGVLETPSMTQMLPQTRHYVNLSLVFAKFQILFKDHAEFTKTYDVSSWKSIGAELFSRKWFVPGALFSSRPHQLSWKMQLHYSGSF